MSVPKQSSNTKREDRPQTADKAKAAAGAAVDKAKEMGKDMAKEAVKAGVEVAKDGIKK